MKSTTRACGPHEFYKIKANKSPHINLFCKGKVPIFVCIHLSHMKRPNLDFVCTSFLIRFECFTLLLIKWELNTDI